jgi:hypothetical protein
MLPEVPLTSSSMDSVTFNREIAMNPIFSWRIAITLLMSAFVYLFASLAYAADDETDKAVQNALLKRTLEKCDLVLPAWLASKGGTDDPEVRHLLVDCYTGHARLSIIGVDTGFSIADTSLAELPAMLIRDETGIDLDIYSPLSGISLSSGEETGQ